MIKLPQYVQAFVDRHGHSRFYFRRAGYKRTTLPGMPWTPTFMGAYEQAKETKIEIGTRRTIAGTVNAALVAY
jgi:hypothetical protein